MDKNRLVKLNKYLTDLQNRLRDLQKGTVPEKHKDRPKEYAQFLTHEITTVQSELNRDKLA